jgi:putative addiction module component (TIGR02574 family)
MKSKGPRRRKRMAPSVESLFHAALALSPESRATLAEKLLESLGEKNRVEIEAAWAAEAESRLRAYEEGTIEAIPGGEVFPSLQPGMRP